MYASDNKITYPFKESNPIIVRKKITEWNFPDSDKIIESEHPLLRSLTIDHGEPSVQIKASSIWNLDFGKFKFIPKTVIIKDLESKGFIVKFRSPWSCATFYVNKNSEIERGTPRLVINYKPLNKALKWIRYPIPNKKDLL